MKNYDNIYQKFKKQKIVFAASGLPNPNSSWEEDVSFLQGSRPANGVYSSSVLNRGL